MSRMYNDPADLSGTGAAPSSIGNQLRTDYYHKKALIEAKRAQYFMPLADVTAMP